MIYLDHAASTPLDPRVAKEMEPYLTDYFYNPSAPYAPAIKVRREYENAKSRIARVIGGKGDELIITAGATESINLAINSIGGHIVTANIEHHAVLATASQYDNTIVQSDQKGLVSAEAVRSAITSDTRLVSIALANNELGTIQPIRDIAEVVKSERRQRLAAGDDTPIYLHCDASQGVGQIDVNVARLGVDMLTLNSSKIYGPKQVAVLWVDSKVKIKPQILGGGQERGLRSGTENVPGVIGMAKAIEIVIEHRNYEAKRLSGLRDYMQKRLTEEFDDAVVSGNQKHRLPGHLHISFPNIDAERVLFALEMRGVLVATGSACAANKGTRSHVLTAIGLAPEIADGSLRITLGHLSNDDNITQATDLIIEEVREEYVRNGR